LDPKQFGKTVKKLREQLKMTPAALARLIGSDSANLGRVESGEQGVTLDTLMRIAKALRITGGGLLSMAEGHNPFGHTPDEWRWLELWRTLPADRLDQALRVMEALREPVASPPARKRNKKRTQ
jgi:transcriptional regulator with XRE-family HTH domain